MNRIERLSAIIIQLQSRSLVKAQDLADKFTISLRTVYRDIRALEEAGVPVIGEAGSGYRMMEGYKLPPIMFNEDEASALLTAGKLVLSKTDAVISKHYSSALDKIKAILRFSEKDHLEGIDDHIAVLGHPSIVHREPADLHLRPLLKAIAGKKIIEIDYVSVERNETLARRVEPVGIYYFGMHWHLVAYCNLRKDYRNFRTDRILKVFNTGIDILKQHPPLRHFIEKTTSTREVRKVVIDVEPQILKYFGEQKYYNGYVGEEPAGDFVRITFLSGSLCGFARWYMLFADQAQVVEPLELNNMIRELAEKILNKIGSKEMLLT